MQKITTLAAMLLMLTACGAPGRVNGAYDGDEQINIGYGTVRKDNLTGSVSKVKVDADKVAGYATIYDYLKGRVPGLDISGDTGPGGNPTVRIRGNRSINGPDDPLFIVDGFERRDISDISPLMIESVEVLKDASTTSAYGFRGANGVIIITTKKQ